REERKPSRGRGNRRPAVRTAVHKNGGMGGSVTENFYLSNEAVSGNPYRYRACGLDGIYLLNGYTVEDHEGERHVAIADVDGLHQVIGRHLVMHRKALAPRELRFLRNTMDLTQRELA